MTNFKSGSGNLDFGSGDDEENGEDDVETRDEIAESQTEAQEQEVSTSKMDKSVETDQSYERSTSAPVNEVNSPDIEDQQDKYPYFIRRSNVGDERDTRLEIHVRDKVADREARFRNDLAEELGANEISKTDAREFALLAAFNHPDRVAELMRDEGFGTL